MALSRAGMASQSLIRNLLRTSTQVFSSKAVQAMSPMWVPDKPTEAMMKDTFSMDLSSQVGLCMPLSMMRIGTLIHHIELRPGQGPKLVCSPGTVAKILTEPRSTSSIRCEVKLPSGQKKLINKSCRAIIGQMSNAEQRKRNYGRLGRADGWVLGQKLEVLQRIQLIILMVVVKEKVRVVGVMGRVLGHLGESPLSVATKLGPQRRKTLFKTIQIIVDLVSVILCSI